MSRKTQAVHSSVVTLLLLAALGVVQAQTSIVAPATSKGLGGFNLFSTSQDVEIGRQSALVADKQLALVNDVQLNRYLNSIVARLTAGALGAKYPYQVRIVNSADIHAFALPGGPLYVSSGLIAAARGESELAGVLAHEISHTALRHGTQRASTAYLGQAGLGVIGGLVGKGTTALQIVGAVGGHGLNTLFLNYSRDDEFEADASAAYMMSFVGYDPMSMPGLLSFLRTEEGANPDKLEQYFSDHPGARVREARLRSVASTLPGTRRPLLGNFFGEQRRLIGLSTTASQRIARLDPPGPPAVATPPVSPTIVLPSDRVIRFTHSSGFVSLDRPENWAASQAPTGFTVSVAPQTAVVQASNGRQHLIYGLIVSHYEPFASVSGQRGASSPPKTYVPVEGRTTENALLHDATNDIAATLIAINPTMAMVDSSARSERISGALMLSLELAGVSDATGDGQRVTVFTRGLPDGHVLYALAITPTSAAAELNPVFRRIMQSLVVNARAAHQSDPD
jgi:Zn-dependent protease with chaperone function